MHPKHLDARGLVALWREALLAQAVLLGRTRGYTRHPQLTRFLASPNPVAAIGSYLDAVHDESMARGYEFDHARIVPHEPAERINETRGQLEYEWDHLRAKLTLRSPQWFNEHCARTQPVAHPLFRMRSGGVRAWERAVAVAAIAFLVTACGGANSVTAPPTTPTPPFLVRATAGDGSASVSFTEPLLSGASAITGYTASCVAMGVVKTGTAPSSPVTVAGLTNGITYVCSVTATNTQGMSVASEGVTVTPVAKLP